VNTYWLRIDVDNDTVFDMAIDVDPYNWQRSAQHQVDLYGRAHPGVEVTGMLTDGCGLAVLLHPAGVTS
jgi:hypothetical protein